MGLDQNSRAATWGHVVCSAAMVSRDHIHVGSLSPHGLGMNAALQESQVGVSFWVLFLVLPAECSLGSPGAL